MDAPGEKFLIKLMETCEKSIGGLFAPRQIKRKGEAETKVLQERILALAQVEKDAGDIKSGIATLHEGKIVRSESTAESSPEIFLLENARRRSIYLDFRREINFQKTAIKTLQEGQKTNDEEVSDKSVDPDWFTRWYDCVKDVSGKDMQVLWAKILAGEIKNPGSFSLHTIDFLRKLRKEDAEKISRIAPYKIADFIYKPPGNFFEKKGIGEKQWLEFEEEGLLSYGIGVGLQIVLTGNPIEYAFLFGKNVLVARKKSESGENITVELPQIKLSRIGRELMSLGNFDVDQEYLDLLAKELKSKGCDLSIGDFVYEIEGKCHYKNSKPYPD